MVEVFLPVVTRFLSLKKELRKLQLRAKLEPAELNLKNLNLVFHKATEDKKVASKLVKSLELISENIIKLSNLAPISSDNENKKGAFVRAITNLWKLDICAKAWIKYEGLLQLENSFLNSAHFLLL